MNLESNPRRTPVTRWAPNPQSPIHANWSAYRSAALEQGQQPDDEEFALLWWHKSSPLG